MKYGSILFFPCLLFCLAVGCNNASSSEAPNTPEEEQPTSEEAPRSRIVFFGNSLTAGFGINPQDGYVAIIQKKIDELDLPYEAINAGLSGETSAGGKDRIDWVLQQPVAIFVLELGGNDGLRGISPEATYYNLKAILEKVRTSYPSAHLVIAGMEAPPNMGSEFTQAFRSVYPRLEQEFDVVRIPFFLEGIAGEPELNLADGIHPNEDGQAILAATVWKYLQPLLTTTEKASSHEIQ
jgi:acyl-CoA thioesterase-1